MHRRCVVVTAGLVSSFFDPLLFYRKGRFYAMLGASPWSPVTIAASFSFFFSWPSEILKDLIMNLREEARAEGGQHRTSSLSVSLRTV